MTQYIDKFALIAEINRLDEFYHLSKGVGGQAFIEGLLSFLNTLEVKEVDLEKEIQEIHKHYHDYYGIVNSDTGEFAKVDDIIYIAEHFFQLGLKAQKGE